MLRRRTTIAVITAVTTGIALVSPVQAEVDSPGPGLSSVSSTSSAGDSELPEGIPEWAGSAVVSEETALVFDVALAVLQTGAFVAKVAAVVTPLIPNGENMLRDALRSLGIQV